MSRRTLAFIVLAGGAAFAWWRARQGDPALLYDLDSGIDTGVYPEAYLQSRGLTYDQARGVVAGAWAESRLDPTAVNPTSGAYGIGQWLGPRKAELFRRYGTSPTLAQQWDFLAWELGGGDHGGAAVLGATTAQGALDAYIRRFMRPAAGAETAGDLARGLRYLG